MTNLIAAIEAGGTKFECVLARDVDTVIAHARIPTTAPAQTLAEVIEFFSASQRVLGQIDTLGIGSFGPVDVRVGSPTWGRILTTPKPGWSDADLIAPLAALFPCHIAIDTDVNVAALAESIYGAGRGCDSVCYVTVGTGIGAGAVINGRTVKGALHPEMGHINVRRDRRDSRFEGICPFHGDCLEGLASGPAIIRRWGAPLDQLGSDHEAHEIIGNYLGQLAATIILMFSSQRVIFGGGVMQCAGLLPHIRRGADTMLAGYLPGHAEWLNECIVLPGLAARAGIAGAIHLAMSELDASNCNASLAKRIDGSITEDRKRV